MKYTIDSPIPPLRKDLSIYKSNSNFYTIIDDNDYSNIEINFNEKYIEYLQMLDGRLTIIDILLSLDDNQKIFDQVYFLNLINKLEKSLYLFSLNFLDFKYKIDKDYENSDLREMRFAGVSYNADPVELKQQLDGYLGNNLYNSNQKPIGVIAPHIDFRVGGDSYGAVYNAIKLSDADTFIILGTAHKMSYDKFMFCKKDFETPLGIVKTDKEFINQFKNNLSFSITENELSHKTEHSIEFEVVMLKHIFQDREIKIVPILAGSFYEYVESGNKDINLDSELNELYFTLTKTALQLKRKVCYIASSDLSHFGLRFGDLDTANSFLQNVEKNDSCVLSIIEKCDANSFIEFMINCKNKYRVCGIAPIYAMLKSLNPQKANVLSYNYWDDYEHGSGVTFAGIVFY